MASRGLDHLDVHRSGEALIAVSRHHWERATGPSTPGGLIQSGGIVVAADATLYYRDELCRRLRDSGVEPFGTRPAQLIAAAYRAWGTECVSRLEGDFAFVLWDPERRRVFAGRDFGGKRPLFHAEIDGRLVIASDLSAFLAVPGFPAELNPMVLADAAAAMNGSPTETCYRGVHRVAAGSTLQRDGDEPPRLRRYWTPPVFRSFGGPKPGEAAEALREILIRAVDERLSDSGPTALYLSGGWDSSAVFAAGREGLRRSGRPGDHLEPISISYPPGDCGREDETISRIVDHWGGATRWLDIRDIPLTSDPSGEAARRAEPFPHLFESANRALATAAVDLGSRVVLDGNGGDQLFSASAYVASDLFASGRWHRLYSERRWLGEGWRDMVRYAVLPALPDPLLGLAARVRGRPMPRQGFQRTPPAWIEPAVSRSLQEREQRNAPERRGRTRADYEANWYLTMPSYSLMSEYVASFALDVGAEHRSPLYDGRVIQFASSLPSSERNSSGETKSTLRRAMRGLLPEPVLAPRPYRTGNTTDYLVGSIRSFLAGDLAWLLDSPLLAEHGIVEPASLRAAVEKARGGSSAAHTCALYLTLQAELWARAHASRIEQRTEAISWRPPGSHLAGEEARLTAQGDADVSNAQAQAIRIGREPHPEAGSRV